MDIKRKIPKSSTNKNNQRGRGSRRGRGRGGRGGKYKKSENEEDDLKFEKSESKNDKSEEQGDDSEGRLTVQSFILPLLSSLPEIDNEGLQDLCLQHMSKRDWEGLGRKVSQYKRRKIYAQDLFEGFEDFVGRKMAFVLFGHFTKTIENPKTVIDLENELFHQALDIPFAHNCLLKGNKTYVRLFEKIRNSIAENIFKRFDAGLLNEKNSIKKDQNILFQFIGCIKAMHFKEILKFKYLSNFVENDKTVEIIKQALFEPFDKLEEKLSTIPNIDILMSFIYFNLAVSRFDGKVVTNHKSKINPNLNKLFLRHYPDYAGEYKLEIESEHEDYEVPKNKPEGFGSELTLNDVKLPNRKHIKEQFRSNNKVVDVFALNKDDVADQKLEDEDLTNRYDFPDIGGKDQQEAFAAPVKIVKNTLSVNERKLKNKTGWDRTELYVYNKKKISKMEENELFPTLGDMRMEEPEPVYKQEKISKKEEKKQKIQQANNQGWEPSPSEIFGSSTYNIVNPLAPNWLEQAQKDALERSKVNSTLTFVSKKKKKKKRGGKK